MKQLRFRSRFVLVVSEDRVLRREVRRCSMALGVPVFITGECPPPLLITRGPGLLAAVVDAQSDRLADAAWHTVELMRRNPASEQVPVLFRYHRRYAISSS